MSLSKFLKQFEKPIEPKEEIKTAGVSSDVEAIEELMMKRYEEREKGASESYNKALYENPPPPSDDEIRRKKVFWRTVSRKPYGTND